MSAPNLSLRRNSKFINYFCDWRDHEVYKNDCQHEDDEYIDDYSDWAEYEKEYYLQWLEGELLEHFGRDAELTGKDGDGESVATVGHSFDFCGGNFDFTVGIVIRYGYYCGFSLDWRVDDICADDFGDGIPDVDELSEWLRCGWYFSSGGLNAGMAKIQAPNLQKRLEREIKVVTSEVEEVLSKIAPHWLSGSILSNGEGIYCDHKEAV